MNRAIEWTRKAKDGYPPAAFITSDIYGCCVLVVWECDTAKLRKCWRRYHPKTEIPDKDLFLPEGFSDTAVTLSEDGYHMIAFTDKKPNINIICHECLHLAARSLWGRGIRFSYGNQEPYAYFLGWISQAVYDAIYT